MMKLSSIFLILFTGICWAQEIKVKNVYGKCVVSNDMTIEQAKDKALKLAKSESLRSAGVREFVASSDVLFSSEAGKDFQEVFESLVTIDSYGELSDYNLVKEGKRIDEYGNLIYELWIDAAVVVHKEDKDQGFGADIEGIRDSYKSHEKMVFSVLPWKDGYLQVFILVNGSEASKLYPNDLEKGVLLTAGRKINFPTSKALDYELVTSSQSESNYVVLVFTKDEVPPLSSLSTASVIRHISLIKPNRKFVKSYPIIIKRKDP